MLLPESVTTPNEPVPVRVARLARVSEPAVPLTVRAELAFCVIAPEMMPLEIVLPVPLTVIPPVVKVPELLRVLLPARVTAPTVPVPFKVARLARASLPAVPLTVSAELAFCVIAPETVPPLIDVTRAVDGDAARGQRAAAAEGVIAGQGHGADCAGAAKSREIGERVITGRAVDRQGGAGVLRDRTIDRAAADRVTRATYGHPARHQSTACAGKNTGSGEADRADCVGATVKVERARADA